MVRVRGMTGEKPAEIGFGVGDSMNNRPLSEKIVRTVADRESVDVVELEPPLYDVVNPEALDSLFEDRDTDGRVEFHWHGYRIVVFSSGSIRVIEAEDEVLVE